MTEAQILFACQKDHCYFKLIGELRYTNASGMDDLLERLFQQQQQPLCGQVVVDITEVTFIDSTHIGLLANLARHCQQHQLPRPVLFSRDDEIDHLLRGLCLDQVFDFVAQPKVQHTQLTEVEPAAYQDQQQGQMILRAHQALLDLSDKNQAEFQSVVDLLKQQLPED
ncbi:MAG: STAS domain-containing protein [Alkalimonas sp.]|nr:STAS domain-containing protein [Alkalimonas sp.]